MKQVRPLKQQDITDIFTEFFSIVDAVRSPVATRDLARSAYLRFRRDGQYTYRSHAGAVTFALIHGVEYVDVNGTPDDERLSAYLGRFHPTERR